MNANITQLLTGRMTPIHERLPAHIVASAALRANGDEKVRDEYLDWYERGQVDEFCRSVREETAVQS